MKGKAVTEQQKKATWPQVRDALVQALELQSTDNGGVWSPDALVGVVDRQHRSLKSLQNKASQECASHAEEIRNQLKRINHFTSAIRRVGEALEIPLMVIDITSIEKEAAAVRSALTAQRRENERLRAELAAKDGPPALSALVALHESNYQDIAYALGIPGSKSGKTFTVRELIDHIRRYRDNNGEAYSAMAKRAEEAEAKLAEDAQGWEERVASRTELMERIKALETGLAATRDELEIAKANEDIAVANMTTGMQAHERIEGELREDLELQAARNLVRALEAEKLARELTQDLEVARAEAGLAINRMIPEVEARASRVLESYDELTLALSYLWGDRKKEKFISDLENTTLMSDLEARYRKRLKKDRKAGNR